MVFFHFDMKKKTFIVPFGVHDDLKELGVYRTASQHIYYLSPKSRYSSNDVLKMLHENTFMMDRIHNLNVINIDCPETIQFISKKMGRDKKREKSLEKIKKKSWRKYGFKMLSQSIEMMIKGEKPKNFQ